MRFRLEYFKPLCLGYWRNLFIQFQPNFWPKLIISKYILGWFCSTWGWRRRRWILEVIAHVHLELEVVPQFHIELKVIPQLHLELEVIAQVHLGSCSFFENAINVKTYLANINTLACNTRVHLSMGDFLRRDECLNSVDLWSTEDATDIAMFWCLFVDLFSPPLTEYSEAFIRS